jgi:hypothetical protein
MTNDKTTLKMTRKKDCKHTDHKASDHGGPCQQ